MPATYVGPIVPWASALSSGFTLNVGLQNVVAGQLGVMGLVFRPSTGTYPATIEDNSTITTDKTWTKAGEVVGGTGTFGVGTGTSRVVIYIKVLNGTETQVFLPSAGGSGFTSTTATGVEWAVAVSKGANEVFDIAFAGGADTTHGTGWATPATSNPGLTTGDLVLIWNGSDAPAASLNSYAVAATGCTFTALTSRLQQNTSQGNDSRLTVYSAQVASGAATSNITNTATASASTCGATGFLRIRAVPAGPVPAPKLAKVVVAGAEKNVVNQHVIVGGVKKIIVNMWVIVGGVKKQLVTASTGGGGTSNIPPGANQVRINVGTYPLAGLNISRGADALVIYTPEHGSATTTNEWGVEVTVVNGTITGINNRQSSGDTNGTPIPSDGYVVSGHGAAADWLLNASVGEFVFVEVV